MGATTVTTVPARVKNGQQYHASRTGVCEHWIMLHKHWYVKEIRTVPGRQLGVNMLCRTTVKHPARPSMSQWSVQSHRHHMWFFMQKYTQSRPKGLTIVS